MGKWNILLVDDDLDYGEMIRSALERAGISVTFYVDAVSALTAFRHTPHHWDALVTDQTMPHMTGHTLVREVKALSQSLPCILCSGDTLDFDQKLKKDGVSALLHKPVNSSLLIETLEDVLNAQTRQG